MAMTMDKDQASSALDMVAASRRRATELRTYADGGDILIGWGLAWLACHLIGQFAPARAEWAWAVGIASAVAWTILRSRNRGDWRVLGTVAAALAFVGLSAMINLAEARAQDAVVTLFVAMSYVTLGLWAGLRFAFLGLLLGASVILGWFFFPEWLYLFLAIGGGGTLICGGIWLKRA